MSIQPFAAVLSHLTLYDALAAHAATALIASLWEGVLLVAVLAVCLYFIKETAAERRFQIWVAAFLVLTSLPFLNMLFAVHAPLPAALSSAPHLQLDPRWSYALSAVWLAAILVRVGHLALQAIKLRSLWRSATSIEIVNAPYSESETPAVDRSGSGFFRLFLMARRQVQLCTSAEVDRPSVLGFFAPRILIPDWLFPQLTPAELHQIVLHELEHLRRGDDWMNLLQKIGLVLFPLNPALFWIDRRLASEREHACDDGVLRQTRAPRAYATCLTTIAERRLEHRHRAQLTILALGAVGAIRRSELGRRVERILGFGCRSTLNPAPSRASVAVLMVGILGGALTLTHAPQLVSFTSTPPTRAALALTVPAVTAKRQASTARFEDVVFHPSQSTAGNSPVSRPAQLEKSKPRRVRAAVQGDTVYGGPFQRSNRHWIVLTSWQQGTPQPVFVTLPDGQTFLATYAADPNMNSSRAGWLLLQL